MRINFYRLSCLIIVSVFLASAAFAADTSKEIDKGLTLAYKGMERRENLLAIKFIVFSNKDTVIEIYPYDSALFDSNGAKLKGNAAWIGGEHIHKREIIADVPTAVELHFYKSDYKETALYPRLDMKINNKIVQWRDLPFNP